MVIGKVFTFLLYFESFLLQNGYFFDQILIDNRLLLSFVVTDYFHFGFVDPLQVLLIHALYLAPLPLGLETQDLII